jgi:nucleotide-binding universal stress UspA family protein
MFKTTVHSILVPVKLNEDGINAIRQAMNIHGKFYSRITLLYVIPRKNIFYRLFHPVGQLRYKQRTLAEFKEFVSRCYGGTIPRFVRLRIKQGTLIKVLISRINRIKYDLVVINKKLEQRPKMIQSWEAGISLVVGEAFCPVITFNGTPSESGIHKIMVPVDIGRKHKHNIAWAIELAKRYNAGVHVVSVLSSKIKTEKSRIYRKISIIKKWLGKNDIPCEVTILRSTEKKPYQMVPEFINSNRPDMVLIMTHQEAILDINYIGKMAASVIKQSELPVFSITPKKETLITILLEVLKTK